MNFYRLVFKIIFCCCLTLTIASCSSDIDYTPPSGSTDTAITHYSFGKMTIDGKNHDIDLTILPGGKTQSWSFDRDSKIIGLENLKNLLKDEVKAVIIGVGYQGLGYLNSEAKELVKELEGKGIPVHISPTREAVKFFNQSSKDGLLASFVLA